MDAGIQVPFSVAKAITSLCGIAWLLERGKMNFRLEDVKVEGKRKKKILMSLLLNEEKEKVVGPDHLSKS